MQEIRIEKIKLRNFKGIKNLEIDFNCKNVNIYGANATGKTTILDAFLWVLFDKDSTNRKDFEIKTLDDMGKAIHFLEHEVELTLRINNTTRIYKKMLKEKWTTRRGQEEQEFSGHETNCWIDDVPLKKGEYEAEIDQIINATQFKILTNPTFFNTEMRWEERRKVLTSIAQVDSLEDSEILKTNTELEKLSEALERKNSR